MAKIVKGKIPKPYKVVIYGPEGIGKSTLASMFPRNVFADVEGSTARMDVDRAEPTFWMDLIGTVKDLMNDPDYSTITIDTGDWAEKMCIRHVCDKAQKNGIEDFGYGKGYTYVAEEFGKLLNLLSEAVEKGKNVVITCHAAQRKVEQPEESGSYDHWELKMSKQVSPMVKEWADMVLFCNYKINVEKSGNELGAKKKATGGKRVMYANHTPAFDAKNRDGLPDMMPLSFEPIAHLFSATEVRKTEPKTFRDMQNVPDEVEEVPFPEVAETPMPESKARVEADKRPVTPLEQLRVLMNSKLVSDDDLQWVVSKKGIFPASMPVSKYPEDFIREWCIPFFDKVCEAITERDGVSNNPFNE